MRLTPFLADPDVTVFVGDALDVLRELPAGSVDCVITSPPYWGFFTRDGGRNARSVWDIATQPYPEAHFATYPEELVRRCLLAGCPQAVCVVCGKPRERLIEKATTPTQRVHNGVYDASSGFGKSGWLPGTQEVETVGWSDCGHNHWRPGTVLDPFLGSGTTALVARNHSRHCIGIELNPVYAELAAKRLQQLSLLAEAPCG